MTLEEIRKRILEDDAFVMSEVQKLRYIYKLKKEIRYAQKREEVLDTESVAEHIFGMHVLANYFLPLEDTKGEWDKLKILEMITWHDIDEIETGDILYHRKTDKDREEAEAILPKVISGFPDSIHRFTTELLTEYETRKTPESKFVKAIDVVEPLIEVRTESYKTIMHSNGITLKNHWGSKRRHAENFPYILRFMEVVTDHLDANGFFLSEE